MNKTGNPFSWGFEISKVDVERREVWGIATAENVDKQKDIVDFEASKSAFADWAKIGNIREAHDPKKPVGVAFSVQPVDTEKHVLIGARVSRGAEDTWQKVIDGTLKGWSIAGKVIKSAPETMMVDGLETKVNRILKYRLDEVSLVDNPANPTCTVTMIKSADGKPVATDQVAKNDEEGFEKKEGACKNCGGEFSSPNTIYGGLEAPGTPSQKTVDTVQGASKGLCLKCFRESLKTEKTLSPADQEALFVRLASEYTAKMVDGVPVLVIKKESGTNADVADGKPAPKTKDEPSDEGDELDPDEENVAPDVKAPGPDGDGGVDKKAGTGSAGVAGSHDDPSRPLLKGTWITHPSGKWAAHISKSGAGHAVQIHDHDGNQVSRVVVPGNEEAGNGGPERRKRVIGSDRWGAEQKFASTEPEDLAKAWVVHPDNGMATHITPGEGGGHHYVKVHDAQGNQIANHSVPGGPEHAHDFAMRAMEFGVDRAIDHHMRRVGQKKSTDPNSTEGLTKVIQKATQAMVGKNPVGGNPKPPGAAAGSYPDVNTALQVISALTAWLESEKNEQSSDPGQAEQVQYIQQALQLISAVFQAELAEYYGNDDVQDASPQEMSEGGPPPGPEAGGEVPEGEPAPEAVKSVHNDEEEIPVTKDEFSKALTEEFAKFSESEPFKALQKSVGDAIEKMDSLEDRLTKVEAQPVSVDGPVVRAVEKSLGADPGAADGGIDVKIADLRKAQSATENPYVKNTIGMEIAELVLKRDRT